MPGPRNAQKKRKSNIKGSKKENSSRVSVNGLEQAASATSSSLSSPSPDYPVTPPPSSQLYDVALKQDVPIKVNIGSVVEEVLLQQPYIHDPGNGPRVRDTRAFLESSFFAQPPALYVSISKFCHINFKLTFKRGPRTHYVRSLLKKKFCKCCARFSQKKQRWYVQFWCASREV